MTPKTKEEIAIMAEGGQKLGIILQDLLSFACPGVSLLEIDDRADTLIKNAGGTASFKTVSGYKWATCLCVNDVVVHGVPTKYKLQKGDLCTIDVGLLYKGFHTDTAWPKIVGGPADSFLEAGEKALWSAVSQARAGNHIGHISKAIEERVVGSGYHIVKSLVGHGVGKTLHEDPQIPGFIKGSIEDTPVLAAGMTIAIEVIYTKGSGQVNYDHPDGWTISTRDHSLAAVFEHTIAIEAVGPIVLTKVGK